MDKQFADVFKPGTYPEKTYVSRFSKGTRYTYEERLTQCLSIEGYLTYIVGPSKIGKTVLCEKVIGRENMVSMSGNDFSTEENFWRGIARKVGISMTAEVSKENEALSDSEKKSVKIIENFQAAKDKVLAYFRENKKVFVLDDFHYAPSKMQYDIACQLKEVIRSGFRAVVISLPYRSDDAIRLNPDLTGRISIIEMEPWKREELKRIADLGFADLKIRIRDEQTSRMAEESIHLPQLMQSICLNIGLIARGDAEITDAAIEESCRFTCMNLPYADVVRVLKAGPSTRGQKRLQYKISDGSQKDIYGLLLKILADNPPLIELSIGELMTRVRDNAPDPLIKQQKIKESLKNWKNILSEQGSLYQVIDWKDDTVYILDNMFLFYIRWGV